MIQTIAALVVSDRGSRLIAGSRRPHRRPAEGGSLCEFCGFRSGGCLRPARQLTLAAGMRIP